VGLLRFTFRTATMPRLRTSSRLHFGLISLPADAETASARRFGSVGLMVESPGLVLRALPAGSWSAEGPLAERALTFARRFSRTLEEQDPRRILPPCRLVVESAPREHVGLGTGTQLALAVAHLLAKTAGLDLPAAELARRVGRGERSALGVHGFCQGGFLVDAGKGACTTLAPLVARLDFPAAWRIVLVLPGRATGLHGKSERSAFARLTTPPGTTEALCRLVLLGMLPALAEEDLQGFGEALFDFNARVGEVFAPVQGGTYASPLTAELVGFLRAEGVAGVGQSSWGPGVFAVTDETRAAHLADRLRARLAADEMEVQVSRGCNHGAVVDDD
jgi:beta-RFAP synthase